MVRGHVSLESALGTQQGYALARLPQGHAGAGKLIHRTTIPQFIEGLADKAQQARASQRGASSVIFPNFSLGFGRNRIDSDSAEETDEYRHFYDSTCETRFAHDVRLLPLQAATTSEPASGYVVGSVMFKGALWTLWHPHQAGGTIDKIRAVIISAAAWGTERTVFTEVAAPDGLKALDLQQNGANLLALVNRLATSASPATGTYYVYRSSDGVTWTAGGAIGAAALMSASDRLNNVIPLNGCLISPNRILGEDVLCVYNEGTQNCDFYSSTDSFNSVVTSEIGLPVGSAVTGLAVYPGIDGVDRLYVGSGVGLWEVDTSTATWRAKLIVPMSVNASNCRRMVVHQGALWIPVAVSTNESAPIYTLMVQGDIQLIATDKGLNVGDGVPTELLGKITWMTSAQQFLFIAIGGGAASRNARILVHNGKGWHTFFRDGTANEEMLWLAYGEDDRIYYGVKLASDMDTSTIAYATANPRAVASGTITTQTSGYIDWPFVDGGMPAENGAWLRFAANGVDLSATNSNEFIECHFGVNTTLGAEASRTATDAGDFLSGTRTLDPIPTSGAAGQGVAGLSIGGHLILNRDATTNTDTPKLRDFQLYYHKQPGRLQAWEMMVDLVATAALLDLNVEAVITNLEASRDLVPLPAFRYGPFGPAYVRVAALEWIEDLDSQEPLPGSAPDTLARRIGHAMLRLEEVIT